MKKIIALAVLALVSMSINATEPDRFVGCQHVKFQTACHPEDVKHYDTKMLRERFVMEKVMAADSILLTYSHYDRFIFGGAMPVTKTLKLENFWELGLDVDPGIKEKYFLYNRELGVVNCGEGKVMELMNACDTWIQEPVRDKDKPFLMPVEDVFSITGRGTVATGRIETGVIHVNDPVQLLGLGEDAKSVVTGVEMFRKILDEGEAGDNVGLLLRGIDKKDVKRGMVITHPGAITPHKGFKASIYVLKKEEGGRHTPFKNHYRPQFYLRTMDCTGEISLPAGVEMVMPGDNVEICPWDFPRILKWV